MPALRPDHFTVLAADLDETVDFYRDLLGFELGQRPGFGFPGAWLYVDQKPILHIIAGTPLPAERIGVLDHMAFAATGLADTLRRLKRRQVDYDLRRLPGEGVDALPAEGIWQLFFFDPNGARVELDFNGTETVPG